MHVTSWQVSKVKCKKITTTKSEGSSHTRLHTNKYIFFSLKQFFIRSSFDRALHREVLCQICTNQTPDYRLFVVCSVPEFQLYDFYHVISFRFVSFIVSSLTKKREFFLIQLAKSRSHFGFGILSVKRNQMYQTNDDNDNDNNTRVKFIPLTAVHSANNIKQRGTNKYLDEWQP